ncbi:MAG: 50S ribosomal protein L4 [Candidatus Komeilibacteria bacterium]|nr:50S ribosomal protein L4 [Candidatus Komeilibacteria bacterium]
MAKAKVYNLQGEVIREEELDPKFFDIKVKPELVQLAVEAQLANARQVLAHTKGRSEVRGGGKKPWRQKGTGRARHGSTRSPIWVGGGITFGPTNERNFEKGINKKARRKALQMVLADKANYNHLILVEDLTLSAAKTKLLAEILKKLPSGQKTTLIALAKKNEEVMIAAKNLPKVFTTAAVNLSVVDVLKYEYLLMPVKALKQVVSLNSTV